MSGGYNPKVSNPNAMLSQMTSEEFKPPFFFGGSQVPIGLALNPKTYDGSGLLPATGRVPFKIPESAVIRTQPYVKDSIYFRNKPLSKSLTK